MVILVISSLPTLSFSQWSQYFWPNRGGLIASPDETRQFNFWPAVNTHWVRLVSGTDVPLAAAFEYE
ncbi:MAG: hypothetical protein AAGB26_18200 [Planctomycetota bacterium]